MRYAPARAEADLDRSANMDDVHATVALFLEDQGHEDVAESMRQAILRIKERES